MSDYKAVPAPLAAVVLGEPRFALIGPSIEGLPWKVRVHQGPLTTDTEDPLYCRTAAAVWLAAAQSLEAAAAAKATVAGQLAPLPDLPQRQPGAALDELEAPANCAFCGAGPSAGITLIRAQDRWQCSDSVSCRDRCVMLAGLETGGLPGWDDMSDLDKGAALLHLHKRAWEGDEYAVSDYPARYFDDLRLTALTPAEACEHAASLGTSQELWELLGEAEHGRLHELALAAGLARPEDPGLNRQASTEASALAGPGAKYAMSPPSPGDVPRPGHGAQGDPATPVRFPVHETAGPGHQMSGQPYGRAAAGSAERLAPTGGGEADTDEPALPAAGHPGVPRPAPSDENARPDPEPFICGPCQFSNHDDCRDQPGTHRACDCAAGGHPAEAAVPDDHPLPAGETPVAP